MLYCPTCQIFLYNHSNIKDKKTLQLTGVVALVRFQIWQRGDIDLAHLVEKLQCAMRYAVCDVICEYRLLTAPMCEVPQHYMRGFDSPLHSAPTSPGMGSTGMFDRFCFLKMVLIFVYFNMSILCPLTPQKKKQKKKICK